ncbi:hypothetical protein NDU88_003379 [Pleurodeles waltl]|uniref:Uncharacterized protein n=1 Tax=Pleurodeles waltl TaxID=8319 RepID=A0AAV7NPJ2_PLEWA|nr:hypothetical protein NDU88_003379 [Pleurodeles waltl]
MDGPLRCFPCSCPTQHHAFRGARAPCPSSIQSPKCGTQHPGTDQGKGAVDATSFLPEVNCRGEAPSTDYAPGCFRPQPGAPEARLMLRRSNW